MLKAIDFSSFIVFVAAFYGGQRGRRLADSNDLRADSVHHAGTSGVCHPPNPRTVRFHMDSAVGIHVHAVCGRCRRGHHPVHPYVLAPLFNRPCHAAA